MSKTKISEFSTTPGNNTDINGINIAEGCAPSGINNAIRELMSDLKEWQSGAMDVYVIPQGTAAAPGIQLYGDLDTGLYGFAANQLGVAVGGASAGYFSSAGWVGNVNGTITGDINATTIDTTNLEVTNIKAKDGTAAIWIANSTGAIAVSTLLDVDNLRLDGNTLSSTDTDGNIILAPNGTGDVYLDADTIRVGDSNTNVTITSNGTADLILNTNSGTNSGSITIQDGVNGNILIATNGTGQIQLTGDLDVANIETGAIKARDGTASATIANSTGVMTIASSVLTTTDINGGTIDNTVIGGATTAAGSFTTVTATQLDVDNLRFDANTISSTNTNGNIQIAPAGTGDVYLDADTVRIGDLNSNATLTTNGTADLILNTNSGSLSGSITIQDGVNGNILISPNGTGQVQLSGALDVTDIEVTNIKAKDGTAALSIADSTGAVTVATALTANGGAVFNENGADVDFRVEGDTDANLIFADASTDRVGIGTNSPTNKLDVSTDAVIRAGTGGTPSTGGTLWLTTGTSTGGVRSAGIRAVSTGAANSHDLVFLTNGDSAAPTDRMRLNSTSLNIGGNFTSTNNTLQVTGNAAIGYTTAAPTTGLIVAGNVGVGTNSPGAKLELSTAETDFTGLILNNTSTNGKRYNLVSAGSAAYFDAPAGSFAIRDITDSVTRLIINSSGNLGLGAAPGSPAYGYTRILDVAGQFPGIKFTPSGASTFGFQIGAGTGGFQFYDVAASSERMRIDSSGNLGIGTTSPRGLLDLNTTRGVKVYFGTAGTLGETQQNAGDYVANNLFVSAESAGTITYTKTTGDSGNAIIQDYSRGITFYTGVTGAATTTGTLNNFERMRLDSSGNLGIGTTSPVNLSGAGDLTAQRIFASQQSTAFPAIGFASDTNTGINWPAADTLSFNTAGTERARITSGGDFLVKKNATGVGTVGFAAADFIEVTRDGNPVAYFTRLNTDGDAVQFRRSSGAAVGSISVTATATAYNTSSDYRLKDNQQPLTGSGDFIDALKPKTWNWKADGSKGVGFVAHEVQAVSPGSVVGEKDAVDADGNPIMQAMEYGSAEFIANIIAELQSLRARVAQLEGK